MKLFSTKTVYHGSPHSFDKFDLSFMGTGEGAQVHGWGIYLAENKETAEGYKNRTKYDSDLVFTFSDGTSVTANNQVTKELKDALIAHGWEYTNEALINRFFKFRDIKDYIDRLEYLLSTWEENDWSDKIRHNLNLLKSGEIKVSNADENDRMLATVEIPDDMIFAEEDSPINKQPEIVQKVVEQIGHGTFNVIGYKLPSSSSSFSTLIRKYIPDSRAVGETDSVRYLFEEYSENYDDGTEPTVDWLKGQLDDIFHCNCGLDIGDETLTKLSEALLKYASNYMTSVKHYNTFGEFYEIVADTVSNPEALSKQLSELGVDGIHYNGEIDGSCYVVFNPVNLIITEKE